MKYVPDKFALNLQLFQDPSKVKKIKIACTYVNTVKAVDSLLKGIYMRQKDRGMLKGTR